MNTPSLKTYIRAVCPPPRLPLRAVHYWDVHRSEYYEKALAFFYDGRPSEFREWISMRPEASSSPTARFLVGLAHCYERNLVKAEQGFRVALAQWYELYDSGRGPMEDPDASVILSTVIVETALIQRRRGDMEGAQAILFERLHEVRDRATPPPLREAARCLWPPLFSLASFEERADKVKRVFQELNDSPETWKADSELWRLLAGHHELTYVRGTPAWNEEVTKLDSELQTEVWKIIEAARRTSESIPLPTDTFVPAQQ